MMASPFIRIVPWFSKCFVNNIFVKPLIRGLVCRDRKEEVQNDTYEGKEVMPDNPQYLPRHVQMGASRIFYKSSLPAKENQSFRAFTCLMKACYQKQRIKSSMMK